MLFKKGSSPATSALFKKGVGIQLFKKSGQVASALAPVVGRANPLIGAGLSAYGALAR